MNILIGLPNIFGKNTVRIYLKTFYSTPSFIGPADQKFLNDRQSRRYYLKLETTPAYS